MTSYLELLRSCPVVPAVMYRRSVFDAVGDFDTSYKAAEADLCHRRRFPVCQLTIRSSPRYGATTGT